MYYSINAKCTQGLGFRLDYYSHLESKVFQALKVDVFLCMLTGNARSRARLLLQPEVAPGVGLEGRDDPHFTLPLVKLVPLLVVTLHELKLVCEAPVQDLRPRDLASLRDIGGCGHHIEADGGRELSQSLPHLLTSLWRIFFFVFLGRSIMILTKAKF